MTKVAKNPSSHSIGSLICGRPFHSVPIQAKICTAVGGATSVEAAEKNASAIFGMPVVNMWWTHSPTDSTASDTAATTQP